MDEICGGSGKCKSDPAVSRVAAARLPLLQVLGLGPDTDDADLFEAAAGRITDLELDVEQLSGLVSRFSKSLAQAREFGARKWRNARSWVCGSDPGAGIRLFGRSCAGRCSRDGVGAGGGVSIVPGVWGKVRRSSRSVFRVRGDPAALRSGCGDRDGGRDRRRFSRCRVRCLWHVSRVPSSVSPWLAVRLRARRRLLRAGGLPV